MKRFSVAVVTICGCIIGPACQAIVGIGDRVEAPPLDDGGPPDVVGSADDGAPDTSTGDPCAANPTDCVDEDAGPPIGCPVGCAAPAPTGWKGPTAVYDGSESEKPASCPTWYTQKEVEAHQGMTSTAHSCDCGTPVITHPRCTFTVRNCNGGGIIAKTSGCQLIEDTNKLFSFELDSPFLTPGSCAYPNQKTVAPPLSFAKTNVGCALPEAGACVTNDGARPECVAAPVPEQPYGTVCIHKDGQVPCPNNDYGKRFVAFKNVDDARTCSACTGTASAGTCGTKWSIRGNLAQCDIANLNPDKNLDTCYSSVDGSEYIDTNSAQPQPSTCTTTAGTPTGSVKSIDPVTFCCKQ